MKIALVNDTNPSYCPYHAIYETILKENNLDYDVIYWNRLNNDESVGIQYRSKYQVNSSWRKILEFIKYSRFVKRTITTGNYDRIILFSPTLAIFISSFWSKKMNGKYIMDYRDLSIEQISIFKRAFKNTLEHSFANVISSPGFKKFLPQGFDYIMSHNFDINLAKKVVSGMMDKEPFPEDIIDVLTIGGIRDYESNVEVIDALAGKADVKLRFVGRGPSAKDLEDYSKEKGATNIFFTGYYKKEDEASFIKDCTFLNIFYPRKNSHDSAISNRFYHALIHRKPIIVTANTVQGDFAVRYKLGVAEVNCESLYQDLQDFLKGYKYDDFAAQCDALLKEFIEDYDKFKAMVNSFLLKG